MIRLIYVSAATAPFSDAELAVLLEKSRQNNLANGITGLLLYRDGDFLQVLEGEEAAVRETYRRIARDSRHLRINLLDASDIEERDFSHWAMGFRRLGRDAVPEGFVDFFHRNFDPASLVERGSEALVFLRSFRAIA